MIVSKLSYDAPEPQSYDVYSTANMHYSLFAVKLAAGATWILCTGMQSTNNVSPFLYSRRLS